MEFNRRNSMNIYFIRHGNKNKEVTINEVLHLIGNVLE